MYNMAHLKHCPGEVLKLYALLSSWIELLVATAKVRMLLMASTEVVGGVAHLVRSRYFYVFFYQDSRRILGMSRIVVAAGEFLLVIQATFLILPSRRATDEFLGLRWTKITFQRCDGIGILPCGLPGDRTRLALQVVGGGSRRRWCHAVQATSSFSVSLSVDSNAIAVTTNSPASIRQEFNLRGGSGFGCKV